MLKQLVALLHLSLSDLMTSGGFAIAFLTGWGGGGGGGESTIPPF